MTAPNLPVLRHLALALALAGLGVSGARAQTPSAGDLLRELVPAREAVPSAHLPPLLAPEAESAPARTDATLTIPVRAFRFTGVTLLPETELQALLTDLSGRELNYAGLRQAAERITRYYRERGYLLARAWLPSQRLASGEVEIAVLEGRLGDIRVETRGTYNEADIAAFLDPNSLVGQAVQRRLLERRLLLLADIPGYEVKAELAPGSRPGLTDLKVEVGGAPAVLGDLGFDNHGNAYTGRYRVSGGLQVVNPGGWGDRVSLRGLLSHDGLAYGRLGYQSVVGNDGWQVGAALALLRYTLGRNYGDLGAEGEADTHTYFVRYPILRSIDANLRAGLAFEQARLHDRVGATGGENERHKRHLDFSLDGDWRGAIGVYQAHAILTAGDLTLRTPAIATQDAASARSAGNYVKLDLGLKHTRALAGGYRLQVDTRAQVAGKNLDSSEKFGLGGIHGVRAYPQGEAAGDDAFLMNLELHRFLGRVGNGSPLSGTVFFDVGHARINHDDWSGSNNQRTLSGAGFALNWGTRAEGASSIGLAFKLGGGAATAERDSPRRLWFTYEESF